MKQLLIILDSGHGGIVNGKYTTAPAKMHNYKDGRIAYEGVINRHVKEKLMESLLMCGIPFYDVSKGEEDIPLAERVKEANEVAKKLSASHSCLYLSIHSNAGGGSGFEVWTSPGETLSDKYATLWAREIKKALPALPFRSDTIDGDVDKEEKFLVLVQTSMPAVLGELLFFDNPKDYALQCTPEYYEKITAATLSFIKKAQTELLNR
jgi:N-acetylmuramoyl-L-alanine amidase